LVDHAKLVNPITINGQSVQFTTEAEPVGVLRNTAGNMPNIMNRIAKHKSGMSYVLSGGLARGHNGNPAAALKVHELYGSPKLFSGLASLVLTKPETAIIPLPEDNHEPTETSGQDSLLFCVSPCWLPPRRGCVAPEAAFSLHDDMPPPPGPSECPCQTCPPYKQALS
jgi:hypothetical protein